MSDSKLALCDLVELRIVWGFTASFSSPRLVNPNGSIARSIAAVDGQSSPPSKSIFRNKGRNLGDCRLIAPSVITGYFLSAKETSLRKIPLDMVKRPGP